ncbi:MAG: leucine-rich repeat domain-containing protein, partial [Clostridia bacterium]|nr:leucine-rich repeat domain-containing protein [Clostridia bacterium]
DINGVVCSKSGIILRAPKRWSWQKQFASLDKYIQKMVNLASSSQKYEGQESGSKAFVDLEQFQSIIGFCFDKSMPELYEIMSLAWEKKNSFYEYCLLLREKSLFNGIELIAENAFRGCTNLAYIFLPNSVKSVRKSAFENSNLKLICLSENLEEIPENCFAYCTQLSTVLTECDYEKYGNRLNIRDAFIFGKINKIASYAFQNTFMEHLIFGNDVRYIDFEAFSNCYLLKTVAFNSSYILSVVYNNAFSECGNINKFSFNGTMEEWQKFWNGNPIGIETATVVCTDGIIPPAEED